MQTLSSSAEEEKFLPAHLQSEFKVDTKEIIL